MLGIFGSTFLNKPVNFFLSLSNKSFWGIELKGLIYLPSNLFPFLSYKSIGFKGPSIFLNKF